ncbi:hypothetical protein FEMY_22900 [Ferrovum myxofaciens]|uniref:Uncharacterized protein n=1 Tax=Ferrovum myxofaciens TaxID=416213 RepID=A0A149VVE2_9PROT|nr:hypothetical protein FEMY_22900 [Ferrovum myxofaciens]
MRERIADIKRPFMLIAIDQHNGQNEFVGLIQPVQDLISGDGNGRLPLGTALDFDMACRCQFAVLGWRNVSGKPAALYFPG